MSAVFESDWLCSYGGSFFILSMECCSPGWVEVSKGLNGGVRGWVVSVAGGDLLGVGRDGDGGFGR